MADQPSSELAESILRRLLVGSIVNGVRFGVLELLFDTQAVSGEPSLLLASAWTVYPERPDAFPENESDIDEGTSDDELALAVSLRHKEVLSVEVFSPWPHLVLTFTDKSVLFLNGKSDRYEPWIAGVYGDQKERTEVIACPGGDFAFILPT